MLSIPNPKSGNAGGGRYYFRYYTEHSVQQAIWKGKGVELLGLPDLIVERDFNNILEGFSRDRKIELVQNAGAENRQGFWDLTLSVPKSLSVLWAAAAEEVQSQIIKTIEASVFAVLREIEETVGLSRRGKGGTQIEPAALTFAVFQHISSRAEDPQLHWHCLLMNIGVREDGTTGALHTRALFDHKMEFGAFFQAHLARGLVSRFNLEIEQEKVGFHISGVPKELCNVSSKRRHQITKELNRRGRQDAVAAKEAALKTRGKKQRITKEELLKRWATTAAEFDFGPEQVAQILRQEQLHGAQQSPEQTHPEQRASEEKAQQTKEQGKSQDRAKREKHEERDTHRNAEKERDSQEQRRAGGAQSAGQSAQSERDSREQRERGGAAGAGANTYSESHQQSSRQKTREEDRRDDPDKIKAFEKELREATDKIFPENQTRKRISRMTAAIGRKHGVSSAAQTEAIEKLQLPIHGRFYRIEWNLVFPDASRLNPLRNLRLPQISILNRPRRWDKIVWSMPLWRFGKPTVEVRIQRRKLFRKAPGWNPLSKITVPAIHFAKAREKPKIREKEKLREFERPR